MLSRITEAIRSGVSTPERREPAGDEKKETNPANPNANAPPALAPAAQKALLENGVPLISCRDCPRPCSDREDEDAHADGDADGKLLAAWSSQEIDMDSVMLGTTKPFLRHVVMSTGRKDWARDISEEKDSLADLLQECIEADFAERKEEEGKSKDKSDGEGERKIALPEGCWQTAGADAPAKLTLTNGSHHSTSSVSWGQSIMLFPDWVLLSDVPSAKADAKSSGAPPKEQVQKHVNAAYEAWMAPDAPRMGAIKRVRELAPPENGIPQQRMRRWALLYRAVVLLCSHKKRDVRCHLAAQLLGSSLRTHAEQAGWEVDERGDLVGNDDASVASSLDALDLNESEKGVERDEDGAPRGKGWGYIDEDGDAEMQLKAWRKRAARGLDGHHRSSESGNNSAQQESDSGTGTLGIFYISHIGGHRYAGNVIIYWPNGAGVWYGRVDPAKDAGLVFEQTIQKGKVIPEFLRAGINLVRSEPAPNPSSNSEGSDPNSSAGGSGAEVPKSGSAAELRKGGAHQGGEGILRW